MEAMNVSNVASTARIASAMVEGGSGVKTLEAPARFLLLKSSMKEDSFQASKAVAMLRDATVGSIVE
jgi:hypothetical protein